MCRCSARLGCACARGLETRWSGLGPASASQWNVWGPHVVHLVPHPTLSTYLHRSLSPLHPGPAGVYARGGMSVVDKSIDLSTIVNRDDPAGPSSSQPSSRGGSAAPSAPVSRAGSGLPPLALGRTGSCRGTPASSAGNTPTAAGAAAAAARSNSLRLSLHNLQLPGAPAAQLARQASGAGSGAATPRARAAARSSAAATPRGTVAAMPTPRGSAAAMPTPRTRSAASSAKPAQTPRGVTPRGAPPKKAGQVGLRYLGAQQCYFCVQRANHALLHHFF